MLFPVWPAMCCASSAQLASGRGQNTGYDHFTLSFRRPQRRREALNYLREYRLNISQCGLPPLVIRHPSPALHSPQSNSVTPANNVNNRRQFLRSRRTQICAESELEAGRWTVSIFWCEFPIMRVPCRRAVGIGIEISAGGHVCEE